MAIDYKGAGVDIEAGESLVTWLKQNQPQSWPHQDRMLASIGGFAALFRADFPKLKEPCLVSATDGVGTKLQLATQFSRFREVGQDLVAMCVNDLVCCGAQPLFFLDYYATGKLQLDHAKEFLTGVQQACLDSDCALVGGETAEMPGHYPQGSFDCAGFAVGVVDKSQVLGAHRVKPGQKIIGIASSGFHSNGFSLVRKLFEQDLADHTEALLKPTLLYAKLVLQLQKQFNLQAVAHITGGGMDNIVRVLPGDCSAQLKPWAIPDLQLLAKERAKLNWSSLLKTFNCGVGLVVIVNADEATDVCKKIDDMNHQAFDLGEVVKSESPSWELDFIEMEKFNS